MIDMDKSLSIGYFGIPGTAQVTKTHIVYNGRPICGAQMSEDMAYQFCSFIVRDDYIECAHCLRRSAELVEAQERFMDARAKLYQTLKGV